jgi:hypothetical protein
MDSSVSPKDEIWFLRVCHHISNAVYHFSVVMLRGEVSACLYKTSKLYTVWTWCVSQKERELFDGMQRNHCLSLIGNDAVTWFVVVDFQTPKFNCYIQHVCFRVCVALVTILPIWYMPWEPEDGWNSQDNNLPFLHRSDKAKDIPKFLPAAGAGILCSKRCLLKQRKQTPTRHPVLTTWSIQRPQIKPI